MISQTLSFAFLAASLTAGQCRDRSARTLGGYTGRIAWETQSTGDYTAASEERTAGTVERLCREKVTEGQRQLALQIQSLTVSFSGARSSQQGSGFQLQVYAGAAKLCELSYLRIAAEDIIRAGGTAYNIAVPQGIHELRLVYRLIDNSNRDPVRIDIKPPILRLLKSGEILMSCHSTGEQLPSGPPTR